MIPCSDEGWLDHQFSLYHSYISFLKGWENLYFELGSVNHRWMLFSSSLDITIWILFWAEIWKMWKQRYSLIAWRESPEAQYPYSYFTIWDMIWDMFTFYCWNVSVKWEPVFPNALGPFVMLLYVPYRHNIQHILKDMFQHVGDPDLKTSIINVRRSHIFNQMPMFP